MEKITAIHSFPTWLPITQRWMYLQAKHLPQDIINCHVVCQQTENEAEFMLENIHSLAKANNIFRHYYDRVLRKVGLRDHLGFLVEIGKKINADLVHSHFGNFGWADINAAKTLDAKHVVTFYGADVTKLPAKDTRWLVRYKNLFSSVDRILCEGPHMAGCIADLGCPTEKIRVHHLGVEPDKIAYHPRNWDGTGPLRVLLAATFTEKKGLTYAIEALGKLQNRVPLGITIIGDARHDPDDLAEKDRIMNAIKENKLGNKTRLLGYQPYITLINEANDHHIFLSPSVTAGNGDTEGGAPVSIIDMMASGMMIVSTTHCDIPNIVKHKVSGLLAPERKADALSDHLMWLVDNPTAWRQMLDNGREIIETEFNAEIQGARLAELYQEICESQ